MPSYKDCADDAQKTVLVQAEVQRMKRHPQAGTAYATNRLKVLDKMLHLLGKVWRLRACSLEKPAVSAFLVDIFIFVSIFSLYCNVGGLLSPLMRSERRRQCERRISSFCLILKFEICRLSLS